MATPITWNEANFNWDNNPHTWDEVQLVVEVIKALGGGGVMEEDMPWMKSQDTKKRLVKLICKVQGKTIKEEKEIQDYKIKVFDIKLLAEKVLGIEVLTENIKF